MMKEIDMTPTWRALLPVLVEVAANGISPEGRKAAMEELYRIADFADRWIANHPELKHTQLKPTDKRKNGGREV